MKSTIDFGTAPFDCLNAQLGKGSPLYSLVGIHAFMRGSLGKCGPISHVSLDHCTLTTQQLKGLDN